MPSSIDNKIVEMTFDNASFERKIAATMASLANLDQKILKGADFSKITDAAGKLDLSGMSSAIEGVSAKFLALSTVGITVLANLTNKAVDAGIQMAKSLSLDQVLSGFQEYELNIGSIQTILANTRKDATTLDDVNAALDNLNTYSDKTIYNFAQMTKNIGSATAAGVSLDDAVSYVKGFANSAAIAGVDATSMAGALEQMSQALGAGVVRAQDWISLERRGLAGQVQQEAFFNMASAMGTLVDVPVGTTFQEWSDQGNTLKASLEQGWLTTDVFLNTMKVFTGELDAAALAGMGISEDMIPAMLELGQVGVESATKVRTFSQLMDTAREAVGSGWSSTFRTVIGDFTQATDLFTGLSDAFGSAVGKSADARNQLLSAWATLGGRTALIDGIKNSFLALTEVLSPIKKAFRDIFPKTTAFELYQLTKGFQEFAENLRPSEETVDKIRRTFRGLFAALDIGWEIIKGVFGLFKDLFDVIAGPSASGILTTTANFGDFLSGLRDILVDGGKIKDFFVDLKEFIKDPIPVLRELIDTIDEFLKGKNIDVGAMWSKLSEGLDTEFGKIKSKVEDVLGPDIINGVKNGLADGKEAIVEFAQGLIDRAKEILGIKSPSTVFEEIGKNIVEGLKIGLEAAAGLITGIFGAVTGNDFTLQGVFQTFADTLETVHDWLKKIWTALDEVFDFPSLDTLFAGVGAVSLGGIWLAVRQVAKFFGDEGLGGISDKVQGVLEGVSGVLKSMALDIKAGALLKIAGAVGILALALTLLAFIDGEKLAKSIGALSAAFGQLVGSYAILDKLSSGPASTGKMIALSFGLGLLAGAVLLLSASVLLLSQLSWEELARGMSGVVGVLGAMLGMVKLLKGKTADMVEAGAGMGSIGGGLLVMGIAMKIFASMDWEELAKGFTGVIGGLVQMGLAVRTFPKDLAERTAGILAISSAMLILAIAVKLFSTMSWEDMGKGLAGVGAGLVGLATAMRIMPEQQMLQTSAAILATATSMLILGIAVKKMGELDIKVLVKGTLGLIGVMFSLSKAMKAMQGTEKAAGASLLVTASLLGLSKVVTIFAAIPIGDMIKGILSIAAIMGVFVGAALLVQPAIPALFALGGALSLLGVALAAIGIGANQLARAARIMVQLGDDGPKAIRQVMESIGGALPALLAGFAQGIIEMGKEFIANAPVFGELFYELISTLLAQIIKLAPEVKDALVALVSNALAAVRELIPDIIETGHAIITGFLQGVRDNIGQDTLLLLQIVEEFLTALAEGIPGLANSFANLIISMVETAAEVVGRVAGTLMITVGLNLMEGLIQGLTDSLSQLWDAIKGIFTKVVDWFKSLFGINSPSTVFQELGGFLIDGLVKGIEIAAELLYAWFIALPGVILGFLANIGTWLLDKGIDLIEGFADGVDDAWKTLRSWFIGLGSLIVETVGSLFKTLGSAGKNLIIGLKNGIIEKWNEWKSWLSDLPDLIIRTIGSLYTTLKNAGRNLIIGLKNGVIDKWDEFKDWIVGKVTDLVDLIKHPWQILSPSRVAMEIGYNIMEGMRLGVVDGAVGLENEVTSSTLNLKDALQRGISEAKNAADELLDGINPTITPVLDLTKVQKSSQALASMLPTSSAYSVASGIAATSVDISRQAQTDGSTNVTFNQTNNSPTQLSVADIYRQTRNQIEMAKEELKIP